MQRNQRQQTDGLSLAHGGWALRLMLLLMTALCYAAMGSAQHRVACVGNSVTYGYGLADPDTEAYPVRLGQMLGRGYDVRGYGVSGATVLPSGRLPYMAQPAFREALAFKPDIVVIHLGLNDTDPRNWPNHRDAFIPTYRALIDSFRCVNPKAEVYVCLMTPIFEGHPRYESGTRDWHAQIQTAIRQIATGAEAHLIDLFTPLHRRSNLFADALHPNAEGAMILAQTVYAALTGDYGGLQLPPTYSDHMVLQRGIPLHLQGRGNAGQSVTLTLCDSHNALIRHAKTEAAADGTWDVAWPALAEGGPYTLTVESGRQQRQFRDVWVGEVWLASGQSNMAFTVKEDSEGEKQIAQADQRGAQVHFLHMRDRYPTADLPWHAEAVADVGRLDYLDSAEGWQRCTPTTVPSFSAIAYYFACHLANSLGCHIGIIENAVGGTPAEAWISRTTLEWEYPQILRDWLNNDHLQAWVRERAKRNLSIEQAPDAAMAQRLGYACNPNLARHPYQPSYMYEVGVSPIAHYGLRGILWYQGESNAHNSELHERLFPMVVSDLRRAFSTNDDAPRPFIFASLSSLSRPSWPTFRDSQRRLADALPYTWEVVTTDVGDSLNVHPPHKMPVAERMVATALHYVYGHEHLIPSGPRPLAAKAEADGSVCISMAWAEGMHTSDGQPLRTCEVAGEDGLYHPARATICGTSLRVSSAAVPHPMSVRYAWQPFTRANLVGANGFPCPTFRLDIAQ